MNKSCKFGKKNTHGFTKIPKKVGMSDYEVQNLMVNMYRLMDHTPTVIHKESCPCMECRLDRVESQVMALSLLAELEIIEELEEEI